MSGYTVTALCHFVSFVKERSCWRALEFKTSFCDKLHFRDDGLHVMSAETS